MVWGQPPTSSPLPTVPTSADARKMAGRPDGPRDFLADAVLLLAQPAFVAAAASDLVDYLERTFCTVEARSSSGGVRELLIEDSRCDPLDAVRAIFVGSSAWDILKNGTASLDVLLTQRGYLSKGRMTLACAHIVGALLRVKAHGIPLEPEWDGVVGENMFEVDALVGGGGAAGGAAAAGGSGAAAAPLDLLRAPALSLGAALCVKLLRLDAVWAARDVLDAARPALRADCSATPSAVARFVAAVLREASELERWTAPCSPEEGSAVLAAFVFTEWLPDVLHAAPHKTSAVCELAAARALAKVPDSVPLSEAGVSRCRVNDSDELLRAAWDDAYRAHKWL